MSKPIAFHVPMGNEINLGGFSVDATKLSDVDYLKALTIGLRQIHINGDIPIEVYVKQAK